MRSRIVLPAALAVLVASMLPYGPALAAGGCDPTWRIVSAPPRARGGLVGVEAVAADDVWAVGGTANGGPGLVLHWNGTTWKRMRTGTAIDIFGAVSASGPNDVWISSDERDVPRFVHWDGSSWTVFRGPRLSRMAHVVFGLEAIAPDDAWAVGYYAIKQAPFDVALILHWDGAAWTAMPPPADGIETPFLLDVAALAANDVWAAAWSDQPYLQWDGAAWSHVSGGGPTDLTSMRGLGAGGGSLWAVGQRFTSGLFAERWNGKAWLRTPAPAAAIIVTPEDIASVGRGDAWAVGSEEKSPTTSRAAIVHDDGASLVQVPVPDPAASSGLADTDALPNGTLWTVGWQWNGLEGSPARPLILRLCEIRVGDAGFSRSSASVPPGSEVAFGMPARNAGRHSVTDDSGLGLFDSGPVSPGGSFLASFPGAGRYPLTDTETGNGMVVRVPVRARPSAGAITDTFRILWAGGPPP
ncbi:MAG TPA: hypothetical protein VJB36_11765, partial [Methylomirabilota bacterium]|nr:hypothetical protein [Methylomirabilota bacterium]